ncbi:MAG: F0F1 ATP synthase subunit A [Sandaracinaceae bacterium]|nr:F0F1 ATP synthase subunit A [Sandaracinaceae bacterium]
MPVERVFPHTVFELGGVAIRDSVIVTWVLMAILITISFLATRRLHDRPGPIQNALESFVELAEGIVEQSTHVDPRHFVPFVGTLGLYLVTANTLPTIVGAGAPTRDLSTTAALATIVFFSVHYYGIRLAGARAYLKTFVEPSWLLLPFNLIGEITRTLALALRLFGNVLSGELVVAILLLLAGLIVPVPMMLLGLLFGVIQAYVFTLLAMVYIAAGVRSAGRNLPEPEKESP